MSENAGRESLFDAETFDAATSLPGVWNAIAHWRRWLRDQERVIAMHPDDITDEFRLEIDKLPLVRLQPSAFIEPGKAYVIRPGLLDV